MRMQLIPISPVPALGMWPFDSERARNLDNAIAAAAQVLKEAVDPKLSLGEKTVMVLRTGRTGEYERFLNDYIKVATILGKGYSTNAEYYTLWEPRLLGLGWDKQLLEKVMSSFRQLNAAGKIPKEVFDPANYKAPGSDVPPIGAGLDQFTSMLKTIALIGGIGLIVYVMLTRSPRKAA